MVKIGVRTHDYGRDTPDAVFGKIKQDGFSCAQLALKKAFLGIEKFSDITPEALEKINTARKKTQITIAVLAAYIEPSLADKKLRSENVKEFIASIPFAKKLDAVCIGTETTPMQKQPNVTRKEALNALLKSLYEIMPAAEENNVTVAIEPVFTHALNTPELAQEVLKTIQSPNLKIIFDPVNLLSEEEVSAQRRLWDRAFQCLGEKIAVVHLKGVCQNPQGELVCSDYSHSLLEYDYIFSSLKKLPQDYNVIREEMNPLQAKEDLRFIQNLL